MYNKLTTIQPVALQLLMTEDLYLVSEKVDQTEIVKNTGITEGRHLASGEKITLHFDYLGENNMYFLILVQDTTHQFLNSADHDLLVKILNAKKMELRDVAVVNINNYPQVDFKDVRNFFSCNKAVLLGISPEEIGLPAFTINRSEQYQDMYVLVTYSLNEIRENPESKTAFWNALKSF